ncbi:MAG: dihydropteroate synthase [Bacteroidota bacterium]
MFSLFNTPPAINIKGALSTFTEPLVMGIINLTPDSFHSESRVTNNTNLLQISAEMIGQGAAILDMGGYSTRPGAPEISEQEELDRLIPAIEILRKAQPGILISADTFRSDVALAAARAGADIINDVSGGADPLMFETIAKLKLPYILMHSRGNPRNMHTLTQYQNLLPDIIAWFNQKLSALAALGVYDVIIDPGFGFAKNREQNFYLLRNLSALGIFGKPVLAGISRKGMVWKTLGTSPAEALNGTTVLNTVALQQGAGILRVHDVKAASEAIKLLAELHKIH